MRRATMIERVRQALEPAVGQGVCETALDNFVLTFPLHVVGGFGSIFVGCRTVELFTLAGHRHVVARLDGNPTSTIRIDAMGAAL